MPSPAAARTTAPVRLSHSRRLSPGATIDLEHEAKDAKAGRKICVPTQVLYSSSLGQRHKVEEIWRAWVDAPIEQQQLADTHFILNAEPVRSAQLYDAWLRKHVDV